MKKSLLLLATMLCSAVGFAQWTKPVPAHVDTWQYSAENDTTVYYLYNKDAGAFFTEGNAWGTQASIGGTGLKVAISKYIAEGAEWDGKTVLINDFSIAKGAWRLLFIDSESQSYVDLGSQTNYFWEIESKGDGVYRIKGADINPNYNSATYGMSSGNAYWGMSYLNDEKTTAITPLIDPGEDNTAQVDWYFISEDAYAAYLENYSVYDAAVTLKNKIDEAAGYGLSTAAAEAVYNNNSSTLSELEAAVEAIVAAINDYKENAATPENPQDLTETYIPDADFEQNAGAGVWQRTHTAQNYQTSGTPGKMGDDTFFLEAWNGSAFHGKMYVPLTGLPNGVYQFTLSVATNGGNGCYVYAGEQSVEVTTGSNMTPYTVFARVENGELEVGLDMPNDVQNWVGIDDAKLLYLGNSVASYLYWVKSGIENAPKYDDNSFVQKAALDAYNQVINKDASAFASIEEVLAYNDEVNAAIATMKENADAYAKYKQLLADAEALQIAGYAGEEADELYDYLLSDAEDIQTKKALSTEEMLAECEKVSGMIDVVKANCLGPGMDCTNLLTNPNFDERLTGWQWDESLGTPAWGGLSSNPNVERWNENFNFYQTVANVPNGVYELKVQAFYRPTGSTTGSYNNYIEDPTMDEILTVIYLNALEAPVKNIAAHTYTENLENNCEAVATDIYVPNGMNSASNAFSRGDYENTVKGVVTDGTLTVGIKCLNGTESGRWPLWDNFRLTYVGMDKETIDEMIASYADDVEALLEEKMNAEVQDALSKAYDAAQDSEDGEKAFQALAKLVDAIVAATDNINAYKDLEVANDALVEAIETYSESPAVSAANNLSIEVSVAIEDASYTTEEILAKIAEIEDICAQLRVPDYGAATDENPVDFTQVIINNGFEEGNLTGWTDAGTVKAQTQNNTSFDNKQGTYYCEKWHVNGTVDINQTVAYLPAGKYDITAYVYSDAPDAVLYANDEKVAVSTSGSYTVTVVLTEPGSIKFGVSWSDTGNQWTCLDEFTMKYYGLPTGIDALLSDKKAVAPAEIYTVSGTRVATLQKGVNIVKMADGRVKKVFIK
ncbi:MAG: hypothetical protein IJV33_03180 [Bacteroidaceae bacterium]|nr:hypothetical protein [Bacteroidaceae bacterium]